VTPLKAAAVGLSGAALLFVVLLIIDVVW